MVYRTSSPLRFLSLLGVSAWVASGCQTGLYQDYNPDDSGKDDTADSAPIDTATDTDTEETEPDVSECHPADPISAVGWTKSYTITYNGATGTETQTGMGADVTSTGVETYRIESHLVAGTADLTSQYYRACGDQGDALWEQTVVIGTVTKYIGPIPQPTAVQYRRTPSVHEQYLPDLATLNGIGIWTYDYQLQIEGNDGSGGLFGMQLNCQTAAGDPASCVPVSGTYTVFPAEQVTVPAGTFTAYKILDQRTELWTQAASGGGGGIFGWLFAALGMPGLVSTTDKEYVSWLYYVEGYGLVKEQTYNASNVNVPLLTRELASSTGLPPS